MKIGNSYNSFIQPHFIGEIRRDSESVQEVLEIGKKAAINGQRCANNFYNTLSCIENDGPDSVFDVIKFVADSKDMYIPVYGGYNGFPASSEDIIVEIVKMGETLFDRAELCKPSPIAEQIRKDNKKLSCGETILSIINKLF